MEQYCLKGFIATYNSPTEDPGGFTYGGYSKNIVADESFILKLPESLDVAGTAPLLCAGITTYSPLRKWNVTKGMKVGIIGLGGLGHMGTKFSHTMGAHTVMITTSPDKMEDAHKLGADEVLLIYKQRRNGQAGGRIRFLAQHHSQS